ncbi:MAG TPA: HEAT repeat domain-containing protein [Polyangia bacterium]
MSGRDALERIWRRRPHAVVIAGAAALALAAGGAVRVHRGRAAAPAAAAAGSVPPLCPVGVRQRYEIDYATRVVTTAGQPLTGFALEGSLELTGLAAAPAQLVRGQFTGTLTAQAGGAGAEGDALAEAARRPFLLAFGADGSFQGARGEPGLPAFVGRLWSALGEYLQLRHGAAGAADWQLEESDAAGRYLAAYAQTGRQTVSKKKLRYTATAAQAVSSYEVRASAAGFELDADGRLASLGAGESLRARVGDGNGPVPGFESTTTLDLRRASVDAVPSLLASWLADSARAVALRGAAHADSQRARDRALIDGLTVAEALSRLQPLAERAGQKDGTGGASREARGRAGRAFAAFTALLRQDPAALAAAEANLRKGGPLTTTLLAALRDAGSPEAQALLAEMSRPGSPLAPEQRFEATRALSLVATPTADTVETLRALRGDPEVAAQATYGLGSALHRLDAQDPALAAEVRGDLLGQLAAAHTPGERSMVLTALGNAGDPATLDAIAGYQQSDDAAVRAAVAQAVRRIDGPQADAMLASLCADPAASVRLAAVSAADQRPASAALTGAVSALALGEPEFRVRARAVNLLAQWSPGPPAVADTLATVASRDPSPDLRNVATGALTKGR